MEIITRSEAINNGSKRYFTNKPCPMGHIAPRWVSTRGCSECAATKAKGWRAENTEHQKEYRNEYRKKNPEIIKAGYQRNKDKCYEYTQKWLKANPLNRMVNAARSRAKKKDLPFDLTVNDVTMPESCPVLGIPLFSGTEGSQCDNSPTLDRIIPELGYVRGNVIVVSAKANRIKNDATVTEIRQVLNYYATLLESMA